LVVRFQPSAFSRQRSAESRLPTTDHRSPNTDHRSQNKHFSKYFPQVIKFTYLCSPNRQKMHLTAERKKEIFTKFGGNDRNTGSTEAQIAMFTERINFISGHLKTAKKDKSAELSLIKLVGKRRSLLNYLAKQDIFKYRNLIKELGLRK
jgi:small subunit ribosomal protein S15